VRKTTGATRLDTNGIDNMRIVRFSSPPDVEGTATLLVEHSASDDDSNIQLVDKERGKWQAMRLETVNLQTGHGTVIELQDFRANQSVPRDYFTTRSLEH
jgi:outer membrane lipoprotein-sorting protein